MRLASLAVLLAAALGLWTGEAGATVPGENGKLALTLHDDIYLVNADGSGLTLIADSGGYDSAPAWAPDGSRLAFSGNGDLWVVNADGSGLERITRGPHDDDAPAWSPDGRKIVFQRDVVLFVIDPDGSRATALGFGGLWPAWSPDGTRLVYEVANGLAVSRVDGSGRRLVVEGEDLYTRPDWSPDGRRLVFSLSLPGSSDLYVVSAGGGDLAPITGEDSEEEKSPSWAPSGQEIAYADSETVRFVDAQGSPSQAPLAAGGWVPSLAWQPLGFAPLPWAACTIWGTAGDDRLRGTPAADVICGLGGDDRIEGLGGKDVLLGGYGDDTLLGGPGRDKLDGGDDNDSADGGPARDTCVAEKRKAC